MAKNSEELALIVSGETSSATAVPVSRTTEEHNVQIDWAKDAPRSRQLQEGIYRSLADLSTDQYRSYIQKVRTAGIEPRDLLSSTGIPECGLGAPNSDFWCLVAARDRLLSNSSKLKKLATEDVDDAERSLKTWGSATLVALTCTAVAVPAAHLSISVAAGAVVASLLPLGPAAFYGFKGSAAKSYVRNLELAINDARSWELDEINHGDREHVNNKWFPWNWSWALTQSEQTSNSALDGDQFDEPSLIY